MITKATIAGFFTKSKVIFATCAAMVTFSITLYNQFKPSHSTEISGIVESNKTTASTPVDAVVKISFPVQAQTETDSHGRFKFKFENLQSDTFLLIVQNKRTNTITKQNEYVSASSGRKDIVVVFDSNMRDGGVYNSFDTSRRRARVPNIGKVLRGLFH